MKIGIITFWNSQDNYGQVLQCFALQQILINLGHDPFLIKYIAHFETERFYKRLLRLFLTGKILHPHTVYRGQQKFKEDEKAAEKQREINQLHPRSFDFFRECHIKSSSKSYTLPELYSNPPQADAYVCGSDQIWGCVDAGFFLDFAPENTQRIAYAASMGGVILDKKQRRTVASYLSKFDFVSLREPDGMKECINLGRTDAIVCIDPTLLLTKNDYMKLLDIQPKTSAEGYILLYLIGNRMIFDISSVYDFAKKEGLELKYVASQGHIDEYNKIYPTIEEWISLIEGAKYVITNSFHGSVFCCIFHKQFCVIPLSEQYARMNSRIINLLRKFKLEKSLFSGKIENVKQNIDYDSFDKIIGIERTNSINSLLPKLRYKTFHSKKL